MAKYKNIAELAAGFRSGELAKGWTLMLDNDRTYLEWLGAYPYPDDSDEADEFENQKYEEGQNFTPGGRDMRTCYMRSTPPVSRQNGCEAK